MRFQKRFIAYMALSFILVLCGCTGGGDVTSKRVYLKGHRAFSIEVPDDWEVVRKDKQLTVYPSYGGSLVVSFRDDLVGSEKSEEDLWTHYVGEVSNDSNVVIETNYTESHFGEAAVLRAEISSKKGDDSYRGWEELLLSGSDTYILRLLVPLDDFQDNEDALLDILNSVEIRDPETPSFLADKTSLSKALSDAKQIVNDGHYTDKTWQELQDAIAAGDAILSADNATQDAAAQAEDRITRAVDGLVVAADKTSLDSVLATAKGLSNDGSYTTDSWQALQDAIEAGESVSNDGNATQSEADQAEQAINDAMNGLESYQWPSYSEVARTPDSWEGTKVAFNGTVLQVLEDGDVVNLRVATSDYYDDIIYIEYSSSIMDGVRVLEGDSVTIYGTYAGLYTYTSVLGQSISIPGIVADRITIN